MEFQKKLYFDGDSQKISWAFQLKNNIIKQERNHAEVYLNKVSDLESKYIALHVGLFWGIGTFLIKNQECLEIRIDQKEMYHHIAENKTSSNKFLEDKKKFINQLIAQRKLKINYKFEIDNNIAKIIQRD